MTDSSGYFVINWAMFPFTRFRPGSLLSYIVVVVVVAAVTLLLTQDYLISGDSVELVPEVRTFDHEGSKPDSQYTLFLINELLKQWNSSGPLVSINITNIIQAPPGDAVKVPGPAAKPSVAINTNYKQIGPTPSGANNQNSMLQHFEVAMGSSERTHLFRTLKRLIQVAELHNFTHMMYSGTLLGSYRHHDLVPWDDDFDIFMEYSKRQEIVEVLSECQPEFEIWVAGARVKFYFHGSIKTSRYPWKWPYVDISFYKENATHIWDGSMEDDYGDRAYVFPRESVFPLHKRPLADYYVNSPRDAFDNLRRTYSRSVLSGCMTSHYSHKYENLTSQTYKVPCWVLSKQYGFVHREAHPGGVKESLMIGDNVLHSIVVGEPQYAITKPFEVVLIT